MGEVIRRRLRQKKFESPQQEVILNVLLAANHLQGMVADLCDEFGISHQQYNILRILRGVAPEGYPCGEIGVRMLDRSPDITRRLDALEREGYVGRDRATSDRRVVLTKITEKGLALLERMDPPMRAVYDHIRTRLNAAECNELSSLCERLYGPDVEE